MGRPTVGRGARFESFMARHVGMPDPRQDEGKLEIAHAPSIDVDPLAPTGGSGTVEYGASVRRSSTSSLRGSDDSIADFHKKFEYAPKFEPMKDDADETEEAIIAREKREKDMSRMEKKRAQRDQARRDAGGLEREDNYDDELYGETSPEGLRSGIISRDDGGEDGKGSPLYGGTTTSYGGARGAGGSTSMRYVRQSAGAASAARQTPAYTPGSTLARGAAPIASPRPASLLNRTDPPKPPSLLNRSLPPRPGR